MSEPEQGNLEEVGSFLDAHYEKFAIMGIFGSVTVFLTNWPGGEDSWAYRFGIVASISIFALASGWLALKSAGQIGDTDGLPSFSEVSYILISLCSTMLFFAVLSGTTLFTEAAQITAELAAVIVALIIYARFTPQTVFSLQEEADPIAAYSTVTAGMIVFVFLPAVLRNLQQFLYNLYRD